MKFSSLANSLILTEVLVVHVAEGSTGSVSIDGVNYFATRVGD